MDKRRIYLSPSLSLSLFLLSRTGNIRFVVCCVFCGVFVFCSYGSACQSRHGMTGGVLRLHDSAVK